MLYDAGRRPPWLAGRWGPLLQRICSKTRRWSMRRSRDCNGSGSPWKSHVHACARARALLEVHTLESRLATVEGGLNRVWKRLDAEETERVKVQFSRLVKVRFAGIKVGRDLMQVSTRVHVRKTQNGCSQGRYPKMRSQDLGLTTTLRSRDVRTI